MNEVCNKSYAIPYDAERVAYLLRRIREMVAEHGWPDAGLIASPDVCHQIVGWGERTRDLFGGPMQCDHSLPPNSILTAKGD